MEPKLLATDRALHGLSIPELERLIEEVCRNGKRFPEKDITLHMALRDRRYLTDRGNRLKIVTWDHEIIGIKLKFSYYDATGKDKKTFRLEGEDWALSFAGSIKSSISDLFNNPNPTVDIKMGPLRVGTPALFGIAKAPPAPDTIICEKIRRRGKLDRYTHEMSMLRLYL